MPSHPFALILLFSSVALASQAIAQDAGSLMIVKQDEDAYPIVSTELVERVGAGNVLALLGEDFLVTTPGELAQMVPDNVGAPQQIPGTGIPGIPPGILPTCQCPEGYVVSMTERLRSPETIFGSAPVVRDAEGSVIEELNSPIWNDGGQLPQFGFGNQVTITPSQ